MQCNKLEQLQQLAQKYDSKLQPLFSIGREGLLSSKKTIGYVEKFGFCEQDIAELLKLAEDMEIYDFDYSDTEEDEGLEFFGVVHAWYALSELKAPEAKELFVKLIEQTNDEYHDDWILSAFRHLIKPYASEIYPYLIECIMTEQQDRWVRAEYLEVLKDMVKAGQLKLEELEKVIEFILKNSQDPIVNALTIGTCVDLKLTHFHELIVQCFKKRIVDIDHMGDLEDVEIAMGLRKKRETERELTEMQKIFSGFRETIERALPFINYEPKIGRNDFCPCGSGKKYKKCCLNK